MIQIVKKERRRNQWLPQRETRSELYQATLYLLQDEEEGALVSTEMTDHSREVVQEEEEEVEDSITMIGEEDKVEGEWFREVR